MKIKPCPFCGSPGHYGHILATTMAVRCSGCGAVGKRVDYPSYTNKRNWALKMKAKAISAWNTRVTGAAA